MMAPKKALAPSRVPRQPAGLPPPALLAKPKALLVPKLVLLKRQHEEEQQRRMRYLRSGAAEEAEEAAAEEEAAADEAWSAWADAQHRLFEEEAEEKAVLDQGDDDQVDQGEPLAEEAEGIANDLTAESVMQFIEMDGGMRLDQRMLLTRLLCNSCALTGVWAIPDDDI